MELSLLIVPFLQKAESFLEKLYYSTFTMLNIFEM